MNCLTVRMDVTERVDTSGETRSEQIAAAGDRSGEFLLLATRADDAVADAEYEAVQRFMGIPADRLRRIRLEAAPMPELDLGAIAGIVVGGSPFTSSDPLEKKSAVQLRVEAEINELPR